MTRKTKTADSTFEERRKSGDRRTADDRRSQEERRHDFRDGAETHKITLKTWLLSKTKSRLGVDRRKTERRSYLDRRQQRSQSLLTQNELAELLS